MNDSKLSITEGFLLAAVPAIGYWLGYLYELGYYRYFKIPIEFIEVGWPVILAAMLGIITGFLVIQGLLDSVIFTIMSNCPTKIRPVLLRTIVISTLYLGIVTIWRQNKTATILIFVVFLGPILVGDWLLPLIAKRNIKGYLNKVAASHRSEIEVDLPSDRLLEIVGDKGKMAIVFIYVLSVLAYFSGGIIARSTRDFIVLQGPPERVVLKSYAQRFIAVAVDRDKHQISNEFFIFSDDEGLGTFKFEKIGPLVPME